MNRRPFNGVRIRQVAPFLFALLVLLALSLSISCGKRVSQSASDGALFLESGMDAKMNRGSGQAGHEYSFPAAAPAPADNAIRESSLDWLAAPAAAAESEAMMVYTASLDVKVDDAPAVAERIEGITTKHGGYRTAVNQSGKDDRLVIMLQIKVPSARLWAFLKEIKSLGEVQAENVIGEDVGDQYFDLKARKDSLDLSLARLKDLLRQSGKLADLLTIEQEVRRVEEQLNQVTGRMKKLENLSAFSTVDITLTLEPTPDVVEQQKFHWLFNSTVKAAWLSFKTMVRGLSHIGIWLLVYSPAILAVFAIVWFARRRRKAGQGAPPQV